MYQRNALTLKELQRILSLRDRPVDAAETLLNSIMEQPDAVFLCFLDVLKHTEQQHILTRDSLNEATKVGSTFSQHCNITHYSMENSAMSLTNVAMTLQFVIAINRLWNLSLRVVC